MKKQVLASLICSLISLQIIAQNSITISDEMATKAAVDAFVSTLTKYEEEQYAKYNLSAKDVHEFKHAHYTSIYNQQQLIVANAFAQKNVTNYLKAEELLIHTTITSLVSNFKKNAHAHSSNTKLAACNNGGGANGTSSISCTACVTNPGFETTGVSDWEGSFGTIGNQTVGFNMGPDNEINTAANTHHITTSGNDEVGGFPRVCNLIPDNHHSFRLGNKVNGYGNEKITYQFTVDALKPYFTYYYAVVIEDAGHGFAEQPYFTVSMNDQSNNAIACAAYLVAGSTAASIGGFTQLGSVSYKPWSPVTIPLVGYIGQCVTITFETRDCVFGGHWGYGYIDADCTAPEIVSPPSICNNGKSLVTLKAPVGAGSYAWVGPKIVGATNVDSIQVNGSGQYTCTMTTAITAGGAPCTYAVTRDVLPAPYPIAKFSYVPPCSGDKVSLTNTTTPSGIWTNYSWDFNNDGSTDATTLNAEAVFTNPTQNTMVVPVALKLKTDYCNADTVINIIVNPKPIANAGLDEAICTGAPVTLNSDVATTYEWYDGLSVFSNIASTNQAYTLTPNNTSSYTLIVGNQYSCKDTDDVRITLNRVPTPDFVADDVCYPSITGFVSLSSGVGVGDVYTWAFEAGKTGNGINIGYNYTTCGVKPVTLVINTLDNCANAITKNVNVYCKPKANFTYNNACLYDSLSFTSTSIGNTTISKTQWDFDYGSSNLINATYIATNDTLPVVSNKYIVEGSKNVVLVVTNTDGCKDSVIKTVTVFPIPTALFSTDNVCLNDQSLFISTSSVNTPDNIVMYDWDFNNDGTIDQTSALNNKTYTYPTLYNSNASLIVTTNNGCRDTTITPVQIYPLPVAQFFTQNKCADSVVTFANSSKVSYGYIKSSSWQYTVTDAAITNAIDTTSFIFPKPDYYQVVLTATTNFGCIDTQMKVSIVYPNPTPNFNALQKGCTPFCTTFNNTSSISSLPVISAINSYQWVFGTGATSAAKNPDYCYPTITDYKAKKYPVTLTVTSDFGCTNVITKNDFIEIYPKPKADFYVKPKQFTFGQEVVQLKDSSIISSNTVWDYNVEYNPVTNVIGNGQTIDYRDSGTYKITQYVETPYGCKDTATQTIIIKPNYNIFIPNAFTPNNDGFNDAFNPKFFGIVKMELLIFNRWGDLIARVDETNKIGWNGLDDKTAEKCKTDVYVWKMKYTTALGNTEETNGKVTLMR
jgi:gliding motility-associated-like protein